MQRTPKLQYQAGQLTVAQDVHVGDHLCMAEDMAAAQDTARNSQGGMDSQLRATPGQGKGG